ncbi:MAG: hypothetical protein ACI9RM_000903 [Ulvibacter sp.]|jgi:hypothetical protein
MNRSSITLLFLLSSLLLISISSCDPNKDDDDSNEITTFDNGFFIVNQGIDNGTDGSISYYDRGRNEVVNNIFSTENSIFRWGLIFLNLEF